MFLYLVPVKIVDDLLGVIVDIRGVKGLIVEEIAKSLNESIKELSSIINHYLIKEIGEGTEISSGFVDGSNVFDERRGSIIVLLSAYGLIVRGSNGNIRMHNVIGANGARKPIAIVLFPRIYAETRIGILMRTLELLVARSIINQDVESVFLDGSYLSILLAPSGAARQSYRLLIEDLPEQLVKEVEDIVSKRLRELYLKLDRIEYGNPYEGFMNIIDIMPEEYSSVINDILSVLENKKPIEKVIDYSLLAIDENIGFYQLTKLLDESLRKNVRVYWIAKDTDSRFLARVNRLSTWITDVSLLDHLWANENIVALRVNDLVDLESISAWRTTRWMGQGSELVFEPLRALEFYSKWGKFDVWYFKLTRYGPVLQLTYPQRYGREAGIEALGVLRNLSDPKTGYPKPLILVHHATRLEERLAEGLGDTIWSRLENPLLKVLLARRARLRLL